MANTFKPKRSYTASNTPTLAAGELGINAADGKMWIGNAAGTANVLVSSLSLADLTGTLAISKGGTNITTYTTGDLLYSSATNTLAKLSGNTTTTKQFLSQTGTGSASQAPAWSTVSKSDVGLGSVENTALSTWAGSTNVTTLGTVGTGTWNATTIGLSKGGTNAALTAVNGGVAYSTASALALTAAGTSGQILKSNGAGAPTWMSTSSITSVGTLSDLTITSTSTTTCPLNINAALNQTGLLFSIKDSGSNYLFYVNVYGSIYGNNIDCKSLTVGPLTYPNYHNSMGGQVLTIDATGTITWATPSSSTPTTAAGAYGDIQWNDGSGGFTASSSFSYLSSAYDQLALYSSGGGLGVFGIFASNVQTYPLLEFRNYLGTTVYSYFDATGNLYLNAQGNIKFADADSSNYAAIQAPATIPSNYTLTLPTTAGTSNYVLKTDGSGNLSWTNGISNLLGGGAGQIPYNTSSGATSFLMAGTSGQVLRSNGVIGLMWEAQGLFSGGRLTLTSATPITTADVTGATTLYYTPYNSDKISVYDGSNWATYTFTERSLALGTLTSGKNYDVFIYNNAGTLTLEALAWSTDTARATALVLTNGIYLKSGQTTRRYLGTFRTTSTTTTEDSIAKRFVWNFNNRVEKPLYKNGTTSHTYTTASWRNWNNDATLRVEFVLGIDAAQVIHFGGAATGTGIDIGAGFDGGTPGYDSVNSTGTGVSQVRAGRAYSSRGTFLGYHYCQMHEYGVSGTTFLDARLEGTIWC